MSEQYASNQKEQELKIEIEVLKSHLNKVEVQKAIFRTIYWSLSWNRQTTKVFGEIE